MFSYLLTTGIVTNYAKRRVKLRIERAKFQNMTKTKNENIYKNKKQTMTKTLLFQFFLIVSPTL